ncbi:MAG: dihydroorotase [Bacteroidales bacterium]|nr:dihydroorotase [Bacteroidales bacterium]
MSHDQAYYIHNAHIVNEGKLFQGDVLIEHGKISRILGKNALAEDISLDNGTRYINATGMYLLPGGIDEHVHFREPGLTHKGDFESESLAAVSGGICTVLDMPNTLPQTTTLEHWEEKQAAANGRMHTNYAFYLGATNHNLNEIQAADRSRVPGVKLFLGSSTGDMLLSDEKTLETLFEWKGLPLLAHCEDEETIRRNMQEARERYGENPPFRIHAEIRSEEACYLSSLKAVQLARKHRTPLHILHISTAKELELLSPDYPEITMEASPSYLTFCDADYDRLGCRLKCNPAVKRAEDREALRKALLLGKFRCVGSDHAPHTWEEKDKPYFQSPSGMPMVAHTLPLLLEAVWRKEAKLTQVAEWLSHGPARLLHIQNKGFIREGYDADLVLVQACEGYTVERALLPYRCGWSPLEGMSLHYRVHTTFVNGNIAYESGRFARRASGTPLRFER